MIEIKPKMSEVGQERMLVELAHLYKNPLHALREYVTNAVDAHGADRRKGTFQDGLVNVDISPQDRRLIITDNASGMSEALMRVLPIRIGDSLKAGKPDQRGEKAVGLLAFGSMGGRCVDIISRGEGDVGYNHLRYTLEGKEEGNECLRAQFERLTSCDVERNFHGGFDRGTRVLVKTTTEVLKEKLTAPKIRRFLQGTYTPLLRAGWLPFWVCDISRNEQEIVDAPTFTGTLLRTERAGGFNAGSKRHPDESGLEVYLFFDPSSDSGSVPFFSKDVRVYDRITDLDDDLAETTLWGCGNVSGYANDPDLKLTLGRESIDFVRNTRTYRSLIKYLMDLDRELKPTIESLTNTHRKEKGNKVLEDAWKLLQKAYQETEPINIVRRGG